MKIIGFELFVIALPNRRHHTWASKMTAPIGHHTIIRVDCDEGISGWGEAPAGITWGGPHMRYFGESPETVCVVIERHLRGVIVGRDPRDLAVLHVAMDRAVKGHPYAKAAIDMACHDIAGKAANVPVYRLLGGQFRDRIEVAHSLGIMPVDKCVEEAVAAVEEGARTIKCKTGLNPERDVEVVRLLRERLGADIKIRVDGNEGYPDVWQAIRVTRRQEEYDLLLCEQPVMGARELGLVAERINTPVMADESAWNSHDILELIEHKAAACISCCIDQSLEVCTGRNSKRIWRRHSACIVTSVGLSSQALAMPRICTSEQRPALLDCRACARRPSRQGRRVRASQGVITWTMS